jgi:hypothetical protein
MVDTTSFLSEARADEKISQINGKTRKQKFAYDLTLLKELKTYTIFAQPNRKAFEPRAAADLKQLIKDMEKTQDFRDRVTGILIQGKNLVDDMDILIKSGTAYLYTQYAQEMKSCSNKETRDAAIRYVLDPIIRRRDQWRGLLEIAEIVKTNLNETYFALREIGENGRKILDARNVKRSFDG